MSARSRSSATVLITGVAGFLGSHLCDVFLKRDWHVVGIANLLTGAAGNLAHLACDPRFRFLRQVSLPVHGEWFASMTPAQNYRVAA